MLNVGVYSLTFIGGEDSNGEQLNIIKLMAIACTVKDSVGVGFFILFESLK